MFPLLMRSWSSMELSRIIKAKRINEILICFTNLSEHTKGVGHLSLQGVMGCRGTSHSTAAHPRGVWAKLTHRDGCCWRNSCWNWRWDRPLPVPINKTEIYSACVFKFTLYVSKFCLLPKLQLPVSLQPTKHLSLMRPKSEPFYHLI